MSKQVRGYVAWEGPSVLTGDPIALIAVVKSSNRKTGNMVQTYIIRTDISPLEAVRTGCDDAICGDCPHRGETKNGKGRPCYVVIAQGPTVVYKSYRADKYPVVGPRYIAREIAGRPVRVGTYGDPAAVPFEVWDELLRTAGKRTGYTHQWRSCDPRFSRICMASCDSFGDKLDANAADYRTFRIRPETMPAHHTETVCPASDEGQHKANCDRCGLCNGARPGVRDVVIKVHGTGARFFALASTK